MHSIEAQITNQTVLDTTASCTTASSDGNTVVIEPCERVDGEVDSHMEVTGLPGHGVEAC